MSGFQSNSFSKHDFNFNHPVQVPFNRQITAQDYGHGTQLNTTCTTNPIFPSFDTLVQLQLTHHGAHTTQSEAGSYNFPGGSQQNEFKPRTNLELQCSQKQYEPPVRAENDNGGGVALREPCSTESLQDIWREFEDIVSNRPTLDSTSQESLSGTTVPVTDQDPAAIILKWFEQMGLPSIDGQSLPHLQAPEETSIATTNGSIGNSRTLSPTPSGTCTASETRQSYSTDLRSLAQSDTEGQSAGTNQCISNTQTETEAARNSEGASATSPPVPARRELFELGFTDDNRCKKCSGLVANSRAAQDKHLESHLPPQFHCNIPNNAEGTNQAKCDYATCRIDQAKRHAVRDHNPLEVLKIMIPIKDVLDGLTALMIEQAADVIDAEGKHITDPHLELLNLLLRRGPMTREEYTQAKLESIVNNWRALDTATLPALTMASPAPKRSSESGESSQASEQTEAEQIMASRKLKKRKNHEGSRRGGALARMSSVGILETRRPECELCISLISLQESDVHLFQGGPTACSDCARTPAPLQIERSGRGRSKRTQRSSTNIFVTKSTYTIGRRVQRSYFLQKSASVLTLIRRLRSIQTHRTQALLLLALLIENPKKLNLYQLILFSPMTLTSSFSTLIMVSCFRCLLQFLTSSVPISHFDFAFTSSPTLASPQILTISQNLIGGNGKLP